MSCPFSVSPMISVGPAGVEQLDAVTALEHRRRQGVHCVLRQDRCQVDRRPRTVGAPPRQTGTDFGPAWHAMTAGQDSGPVRSGSRDLAHAGSPRG